MAARSPATSDRRRAGRDGGSVLVHAVEDPVRRVPAAPFASDTTSYARSIPGGPGHASVGRCHRSSSASRLARSGASTASRSPARGRWRARPSPPRKRPPARSGPRSVRPRRCARPARVPSRSSGRGLKSEIPLGQRLVHPHQPGTHLGVPPGEVRPDRAGVLGAVDLRRSASGSGATVRSGAQRTTTPRSTTECPPARGAANTRLTECPEHPRAARDACRCPANPGLACPRASPRRPRSGVRRSPQKPARRETMISLVAGLGCKPRKARTGPEDCRPRPGPWPATCAPGRPGRAQRTGSTRR